ncbi:hypothetical protein BJX63DRAFT_431865 [Aspergillus granulosus]|uniref:DUF7702 domain-containing protein n=1 Tax=Aspergillus granulosus TaxID=176169 RepID=A0ABR4HDH1_9EURO
MGIVDILGGEQSQGYCTPVEKEGSTLLHATLLALPLIEILVIYFLVAEYTQRADLNPTRGTLAVRVVLAFLPELIAAIILVVVGIRTRDVSKQEVGLAHGSRRSGEKRGRRRQSQLQPRPVRRDAWV